jgi:hypothetical protein
MAGKNITLQLVISIMVRVSSIALMAIAIMDKNCFLFICSFITFVGNIILMREFNKSNKS